MTMLSPPDLERYHDQGFLSPLPLLTAEEAAGYRAKLEAFERDHGDQAAHILRHKSHLVLTWADALVRHPCILDAVSDLLGPDLLCWSSSFFIKNARDPRFVSWHQDSAYWGLDSDDGIVTAWLALSASRKTNGCMRIIAGSQRTRLTHRETEDRNNFLTHGQTVAVDESQAVELELEAGQCCLFHPLALHGSNPNPSDERRIGFAIRYVQPQRRQREDESDSAMLVRGEDRYGHFEEEPRPTRDAAPEAIALQNRVLGVKDGGIFLRRREDG